MPKLPPDREICTRVAQILRQERLDRNLSLTRTAAAAGLSRQMVSYVETGQRIPTLETLLRLSRALEIDLGKIISRATKDDWITPPPAD